MFCFFFFNDTATTEIYTLPLHDALPISPPRDPDQPNMGIVILVARGEMLLRVPADGPAGPDEAARASGTGDRKSTRLNSSHSQISYAVFCLKKKKSVPSPTRVGAQLALS